MSSVQRDPGTSSTTNRADDLVRGRIRSSRGPLTTLLLALGLLSCESRSAPRIEKSEQNHAATSQRDAKHERPQASSESDFRPRTLQLLDRSAYGTSVHVDEQGVTLVTPHEVLRFRLSESPTKASVDLGPHRARMGQFIVFWKDGKMRLVDRGGKNARVLGRVERAPYLMAASTDHFAWVEKSSRSEYFVKTLRKGREVVVSEPLSRIECLTMIGDWAFFVEVVDKAAWRIGGASTSSNQTAFSEAFAGRPPALLATSKNSLYFYDSRNRRVVKMAADLRSVHTEGEQLVCSPLTASDRVVCAEVGGLFELTTNGEKRPLVAEDDGPITAVGASHQAVAWVTDVGSDKLALRIFPLRAPE